MDNLRDLLEGVLAGGPVEIPVHDSFGFLRCTACGRTRKPKVTILQGVRYAEEPGAECERCKTGTMGPPDGGDECISELLAYERERADLKDAASKIAQFHTELTERGVDSYAAAMITMAFSTGQVNPRQFKGWNDA